MSKTKVTPMFNIKITIVLVTALALTVGAAPARARQQSGTHAPHAQKSTAAHDCPHDAKRSEDKTDKHDASGHSTSGHAARDAAAKGHDGHLAAVNERGERAMGFSQTRTTHHFLLKADGGVIEVEADDARDAESRDRVRQHLAHVARAFAAGDFRTPLAVHDRVPPGAHEMCRLRASIKYEFEQTERGGRVLIRTDNKEALAAVHEFLRFQIKDHQTGDKLEVTN